MFITNRMITRLCILGLVSLVLGCVSEQAQVTDGATPVALAPPATCNSDQCTIPTSISNRNQINQLLAKRGISVIESDDSKIIIIPNHYLFKPTTAEFVASAKAILTTVATLACNAKQITVIGHMADIGFTNTQFTVTSHQANAVAKYLQKQRRLEKIPVLVLALGSHYPLASQHTTLERAKNNVTIIGFGKHATDLDYYRRFVLTQSQ